MSDPVTVVTGGSGGLGGAIARALAEDGADVALVYRSHREAAEKTADEIRSAGRKAAVFQADVGDPEQVTSLAAEIRKACGDVGGFVHAAGTRADGAMMMMNEEQWRSVLRSTLDGAFYCCRAFVRDMIARRSGSIVLVSSMSALRGVAGQANYSAAHAGLLGLTRSLAAEVGRYNIRVNAVAPGLVETDSTAALPAEHRERLVKTAALGRAGRVEEIAGAVRFLSGRAASFITGQVLAVDGGLT